MEPWAWALLFMILAGTLAVLESFIPSGGALAFLALAAVGASIFTSFAQGPAFGVVYTALSLIGVPVFCVLGLRYWAKSPIGRRIMLDDPEDVEKISDTQTYQQFKQLEGCRGRARSKMLPSGAIEINGRTYDAVSEGPAISPGEPIEVVRVHGTQIEVRPLVLDADTADAAETQATADPLSRPLDALDIQDPFEDERADGQ